jgi:hypothetical protein
VAAFNVQRELEYGLAFYRNRPVMRYERGEVPAPAHLLITRHANPADVDNILGGRPRVRLGSNARQALEFYWVSPR